MNEPRKIMVFKETLNATYFGASDGPVTRVAAAAVFHNPLAGQAADDLSVLFQIGAELGERLSQDLVSMLPNAPVSYGKAAIVGVAGEMEHGGAVIHPRLGAPMRSAAGGGQAVIPSNVKIGPPGTQIDLPLGHKDDPWSFDHFDTMTLMLADAPGPAEIMMIIGYADGGRLHPRCGSGPTKAD